MKRLARGARVGVRGRRGEPREPVAGGHRQRAFRDRCCQLRPTRLPIYVVFRNG